VAEVRVKSLERPDEVIRFPNIEVTLVEVGDVTVGRVELQPGWRWSEHVRPTVGGDWCQARHVGVVVSGRFGIRFEDGTSAEFSPGDVFDIPAGHDGYAIGDEPCVHLEWTGLRAFAGFTGGFHGRSLVTLLLTDIVDSTAHATRLGDSAWQALLSDHFEHARAALHSSGGREIKTTGDGLLATFNAPGSALYCAQRIRDGAHAHGFEIRAGVHIGEVGIVGNDVRGAAVHQVARITAAAGAGEILVSETTRALALATGARFDERGTHVLKGFEGEWPLYAYAGEGAAVAS
jgi:class 3 adenylate cyclase/quercetin dioxygenase-like cupin family protein